jgi:hypothetical protein
MRIALRSLEERLGTNLDVLDPPIAGDESEA